MKVSLFIISCIVLFCIGCNETQQPKKLPFLGPKEYIEGIDIDTIYHTIPYWSFTNQDGKVITKKDYDDNVYIAYYFFTHCPTICPAMTKQVKRLQQETNGLAIKILAHTVDPKNDTPERLKYYAEEYQFDFSNINFVTGEKQALYKLGVEGYLLNSEEDALAPGGFLHSETLVLIDKKSRIRGAYDGTEEGEVNQLLEDIKTLLNE